MKKMISLVMVCVILLGLCACSSEPTLVGTAPNNQNDSTQAPTTGGDKVFKLGDSVELDGVVVSFVALKKSSGSQFNTPADGNEFLLCEFEISNNSAEELNVSSMLNFEAYCDDYACELSLSALIEKGDANQLDGTVAAGKKMKGVIGYEVPTTWKELEIQYTLDIFSNNKIVFVTENS